VNDEHLAVSQRSIWNASVLIEGDFPIDRLRFGVVLFEMNRKGVGKKPKPIPDYFGVVIGRNIIRVVGEFQPPETFESDNGRRTETGVNDFIAGDGTLDDCVESTLLHRSAKNESITPVDPDQVYAAQEALHPIRLSKITPEIKLNHVEAEANQLFRLFLQKTGSYFRAIVERIERHDWLAQSVRQVPRGGH
jgi:hypothetical protein